MNTRNRSWPKLIVHLLVIAVLVAVIYFLAVIYREGSFEYNFTQISSDITQRYDQLNNKSPDAYKADNLLTFGGRFLNSSQPFINRKETGAMYCSTKLNGSEIDQVTAILLLRKILFSNDRSHTYPFPNPSSSWDKHGNVIPAVYNREIEKYLNPFLELESDKPLLSKVISGTKEVIEAYKRDKTEQTQADG